MNKREFLEQIRSGLCDLPEEDAAKYLDFYGEMIDDRMEDGLTEDEAVEALGSVDSITAQIREEHQLPENEPVPADKRRKLRAWQIVLLILGSPVWLPLVLAAGIILLAVFIVLWSVVITLYSVEASFAGVAVGGIAGSAVFLFSGEALQAAFLLGSGLICAGLAVLFFFVCNLAAKGVIILIKKTASGINRLFTGKENV